MQFPLGQFGVIETDIRVHGTGVVVVVDEVVDLVVVDVVVEEVVDVEVLVDAAVVVVDAVVVEVEDELHCPFEHP